MLNLDIDAIQKKLFRSKIIWAIGLCTLITSLLFSRFFYLQVTNVEAYRLQSKNNRLSVRPLAPIRGTIYDRNGEILAQNQTQFNLIIERKHFNPTLIRQLKSFLKIDDQRLQKIDQQQNDPIVLLNNMSPTTIAKFSAHQSLYPNITIHTTQIRYYPKKEATAHLIGYVKPVQKQRTHQAYHSSVLQYQGKTGIEYTYQNTLVGKNGQIQIEKDAQNRTVQQHTIKHPETGQNIYTTIDSKLQSMIHQLTQDKTGVVIVMHTKTGEILSAVSQPTFDPNQLGVVHNYIKHLKKGALFNRIVLGQYPPASTIKPFIGLAGLEKGVIKASEKIHSKGFYQLPNSKRKFRDWKKNGHGWVNLASAIAQSSDDFFYELAYRLGMNNMKTFLTKFGFGQKTGIDLPFEKSGLIPSKSWKQNTLGKPWYIGETLINGIGQGYMLTTPIQLITAFNTLANQGIHRTPKLIKAIENTNTKQFTPTESPKTHRITLQNNAHWHTVIEGMIQTTQSPLGTANRVFHQAHYQTAGKTGTAQVTTLEKARRNKKTTFKDHALFAAFAPAKNPTYVVLAIFENIGSGSRHAAPIVKKILDSLIDNAQTTD